VRICLTLRVRGDEATLDFEGTDPQVSAAFNIPSYGMDGHYLLVMGLINYMRTVNPDLVYNSGLVRPVRFRIPLGTLLHPEPYAPCGARQATFFRVADVVHGALCRAMPQRMPAAGCGQGSIMLVSTPDISTGRRLVSIVQPLVGGSGGRPAEDGTDGVDFATGFYRNIPTEVLESEMPVLVEEYGLRPGSGGAGRTRGGCGLRYALRVLAPGSLVTARGLERFRFQPWGREGGSPGSNGQVTLSRPGETPRSIGKIDVLELPAQGMVLMETAGGGGYGPPWERPPEDVLRDVEDGLVFPGDAEERYGVVIRGGQVDAAVTEARRARLRAEAPAAEMFAFGQARVVYELIWPDLLQRAVNEATKDIPPLVREHVRHQLMEDLEKSGGGSVSLGDLQARVAAILEYLALGRPAPA
jgi:N-methylhydantoinase B